MGVICESGQDPIGLLGSYSFALNINIWSDSLCLSWLDILKNHGVITNPYIINVH